MTLPAGRRQPSGAMAPAAAEGLLGWQRCRDACTLPPRLQSCARLQWRPLIRKLQILQQDLGASPMRRPGCERRGAVGVGRRPSGLHPSHVAVQSCWLMPDLGQATVTRRAEPRAARGFTSLPTPTASQPRRARGLGRPAGKPDDRARSRPRAAAQQGAGPGIACAGAEKRAGHRSCFALTCCGNRAFVVWTAPVLGNARRYP